MKLRHAPIGASILVALSGVAFIMTAGACKPPRQNDWRSPPPSTSGSAETGAQPRGDGGTTPFGHPPSKPGPPGQPAGPSIQPSPNDIQI